LNDHYSLKYRLKDSEIDVLSKIASQMIFNLASGNGISETRIWPDCLAGSNAAQGKIARYRNGMPLFLVIHS
jgi:hypothetical protein